MKTLPTVDTLQPILHSGVPVITTELLATLYGSDTANIKKNYSRNKMRFIEGKHYFLIKGEELRGFKNSVTMSHRVDKRTPKLTLWTERGAARHAKMLETDQAWEVFERLEDCYFNSRESSCIEHDDGPNNTKQVIDALNTMPEHFITAQNGKLITTSLAVAEAFGKQHFHILRSIETLDIPTDFSSIPFSMQDMEITVGKGARRKSKIYRMTKDGFMLLVMGFTGKKAMAVKIAYINAFNEMAKQLQQQRDKEARKKLTEQAAIAARSSKEHTRLVTQPDYRQDVLKEFDRIVGKGGIPLNLDGMVREKVISALLLDLLRNSRAIVSFDENLVPKISTLPATGIVVDPFNQTSVLNLVKSSIPVNILQALIVACVEKLAKR
ncbi:TPA: Rha family transcriptional regulator [Klebsiella aerogenes]